MSEKYIATPKLFFASLTFFGNILCPNFSQKLEFKLPNREIPERTTPGGSRNDGQCFLDADKATLTPLIPNNNFGFTLAQYPTIFVHIPITTAERAFFSIKNRDGDFHYQKVISLPKQSGAIAISISEVVKPLEIDINYQWSLALICGAQLEPDDPQVVGWIQRVETSSSLAQLSELEISPQSVCLLSQQGIWYDLVYHLAELRKAQPENSFLIKHWAELLTTVGLEEIATEPLSH